MLLRSVSYFGNRIAAARELVRAVIGAGAGDGL